MPKHYIIADDSMFARMLLKDAVRELDPEAVYFESTSGAHSLELHAEHQIDWYLLDINIGDPDGLETAKRLLTQGVKSTQIALVTGTDPESLLEEARQLGVSYIRKALSPDDLDGFISRLRTFLSA